MRIMLLPKSAAFTSVLFAAAYALGAYATLRRAAAGLILATPVVVGKPEGFGTPGYRPTSDAG